MQHSLLDATEIEKIDELFLEKIKSFLPPGQQIEDSEVSNLDEQFALAQLGSPSKSEPSIPKSTSGSSSSSSSSSSTPPQSSTSTQPNTSSSQLTIHSPPARSGSSSRFGIFGINPSVVPPPTTPTTPTTPPMPPIPATPLVQSRPIMGRSSEI